MERRMRFFIVIGAAVIIAVSGGTVIADSLTKSVSASLQRYDTFMQAAENGR